MDDVFADMHLAIFDTLAHQATLEGQPVRAIPTYNVELVGEFGQVVERRTTLAFLKSEAPNIKRGQAVMFNSKSYKVDQTNKEDEHTIEVFVK